MKKIFASAILSMAAVLAANAEPVLYEASLTDIYGTPSRNETVTLTLSLIDNEGNTLYTETHSATTDGMGRLQAMVGTGTATQGTFSDPVWESSAKMGITILPRCPPRRHRRDPDLGRHVRREIHPGRR